jgi:hypothetical protein
MKFFVYELWNPFTLECIYVGKASRKRRIRDHIAEAIRVKEGRGRTSNRMKTGTILKIMEMGAEPVGIIVDEYETELEAWAGEVRLIQYYGYRKDGSGTLTNIVEGGGGATGWHHTAEAIAAITLSATGRGHTAEVRERIRVAATGRKHSKETRLKISEVQKGRKPHPNFIAGSIAAHTGVKRPPFSAEWRRKCGNGNRDKPWSAARRAVQASRLQKLESGGYDFNK